MGSDRSTVDTLIRMAAAQKVEIDVAQNKDGTADIRVPAGTSPSESRGELWIGLYDSAVKTEVRAGENRGETIVNANIVRTYKRIGFWAGGALTKQVDLKALGPRAGTAVSSSCRRRITARSSGPHPSR